MMELKRREAFRLAEEVLKTPIDKIPKINIIATLIGTLLDNTVPLEDTNIVYGDPDRSGIIKKKEISLVMISNMDRYCINVWIIYENDLLVVEIDNSLPCMVRRVCTQPWNKIMSSTSYVDIYSRLNKPTALPSEKTILELLKLHNLPL